MRQLAAVLLLCAVLVTHAAAQSVVTIVDTSPVAHGSFGLNVTPFGPDLLIASERALYLADPVTGAVLRTIPNPTVASGGRFGSALAVMGTKILAGSPSTGVFGAPLGAAYLFEGTTGALEQSFYVPAPSSGTYFGISVAFLGTKVLIGEPYPGTVHVFDAASGAYLQSFTSPNPTPYGAFGTSLAAFGADFLVGAPGEGSGNAYLLDGPTGALLRTFVGTSGASDALFGGHIVVQGGLALMSERGFFSIQGRVHLVDVATGVILQTFLDPGPAEFYGYFAHGRAPVTWMGSDVLVTSWFGTQVYLFDGATAAVKRSFRTVLEIGYFSAVTTVGGNVVIGAPLAGLGALEAGAAYVFCGGITGCGPCETCGPAGSCVLAPNPSCRPTLGPERATLTLGNSTTDAADQLLWKGGFDGGWVWPNFHTGQFGDPTTVTDHTLCLWDESSGPATLLFRAQAPAGGTCGPRACWSPLHGGRGFRYRDPERTPDGLIVETIDGIESAGKIRLTLRGKGEHLSDRPLGLPSLPLPLPARAQLQMQNGLCWEAHFSTASVNTTASFRGKSD